MNIFYCCGVLEPQKKIWWKNILQKQSEYNILISKKYSSDVTHIVCGRDNVTSSDIFKVTGVENFDNVKVVKSSWLFSCMKAKRIVNEDDFLVIFNDKDYPTEDNSISSLNSTKRGLDSDDTACSPKQRKRVNDASPLEQRTLEIFLPPPPQFVRIGSLEVAAYGIGTLAWGVSYPDPSARPPSDSILKFLQVGAAALSPHKVLVDTADSYCVDNYDFGYMEDILGSLKNDTNDHVIATKGGMIRIGSSSNSWREANYDTSEAWEACIRASLARLKCDASNPIDLWQIHHCTQKNLVAAMKACRKLLAENIILHVGLCNVSISDVELCSKYVPIASVQNPYSMWDRTAERPMSSSSSSTSKRGMLAYCTENSIPFIAYGVLGGLSTRRGEEKWQSFPELTSLAKTKGIHITTLVLAMMRYRFPCMLPLVGSRRIEHLEMLRDISKVRLTKTELEMYPPL